MLGKEEKNMVKAKVDNNELEILKQQLAEMSAKLAQISGSGEKETKDSEDNSGKEIRIALDEYIKVMSLCPNELNLSTRKGKGGKTFVFNKLYEVKRIMYQDLADILENHRNFVDAGFFVILNKDVIRHQGLDDAYAKILTKEKMVEDIVNGKEVDLNFVDRISRAVGYSLVERAEDIKKSRDVK
jgi:hypothetical protein